MENPNVSGSRALIASIIKQAIIDAKTCRAGDFSRKSKLRANEKLSLEARSFLSDKSWLFCTYSELIGIEPKWLSENINKQLKLFDEYKKNSLKLIQMLLTS